jgi:hypothetical protein
MDAIERAWGDADRGGALSRGARALPGHRWVQADGRAGATGPGDNCDLAWEVCVFGVPAWTFRAVRGLECNGLTTTISAGVCKLLFVQFGLLPVCPSPDKIKWRLQTGQIMLPPIPCDLGFAH